METKKFFTTDKSEWPTGPWSDEPDKMQYPDPDTLLPSLIVRNRMGSLCGYVGVAKGNPLYGNLHDHPGLENIDVHGGLSFSGPCNPGEDESTGICHTPDENEPGDVWWFGFDCGHYCDLSPAIPEMKGLNDNAEYRTIEYVKGQNAKLAQQLQLTSEALR